MAHSTVDDITGVFSVVTIGTWLFFLISQRTAVVSPSLERIALFWLLGIVVVPLARAVARSLCHRAEPYLQNTVVVGPVRSAVRSLGRSLPILSTVCSSASWTSLRCLPPGRRDTADPRPAE